MEISCVSRDSWIFIQVTKKNPVGKMKRSQFSSSKALESGDKKGKSRGPFVEGLLVLDWGIPVGDGGLLEVRRLYGFGVHID